MLDDGKTAARRSGLKTSKRPSGPSPLYPRRSTLSGRPNAFPLHNVRHVLVQTRPRQSAAEPNETGFHRRKGQKDRQAPQQTSAARQDRKAGRLRPATATLQSQRRWWSQTGSNRRPHACKARALPTELWPLLTLRRKTSRQLGHSPSSDGRLATPYGFAPTQNPRGF